MEANAKKSKLPIIAFAMAALVSTIPSAVFASDETRTERVDYSDLNLASDAGIKTLDRRLDRAVRRVCGTDDMHNLQERAQVIECQAKARAGIVPQRKFAIAQATGHQDRAWAENTPRSNSVVSLSE